MGRLRMLLVGVFLFKTLLVGAETGMVSGFVRDASNGEFLEYVYVYLADNTLGTATNKGGYYALTGIPPGSHTLVVSMIGYSEQKVDIEVQAGRRIRKDFSLKSQAIGMETVEVTAERSRFEHEVDIGIKRMDFTEMRQIPGFVEQDLFRALEMLPGVISVSDFTSALYIRGGTMDQNLVLLDGVTVYNPYHLLGFYSTFILESLKGAELYMGGFPAKYGGAISSVLDVEMKAGNSERVAVAGEVGLLTSKVVAEGPLPFGAKGSWLFAGRRTYIDAITWTVDKIFKRSLENSGIGSIYLPYHFYDLQTKINWDASAKSRFTVSGFFGDDVVDFQSDDSQGEGSSAVGFRWGNGTLGLRWRYLFSPKLFSYLSFNATRYRINTSINEYDTTGAESFSAVLESGIADVGLKWDLTWFATPEAVVDFGIEGKGIETRNLFRERWVEEDIDTTWMNERDTFWLAGAYIQSKWEPTPLWVIETGLRGEFFSNGNYWRASPRLGVKRRLNPDWVLKAGAGLYYQYLYVPYPKDEMMLKMPVQFFQLWLPVDSSHAPLRSVLATLGTEYRFPKHKLSVSVEGYFKDMYNLREGNMFGSVARDEESTEVSVGIGPPDTIPGRGYSYGGEVLVKYKSYWLGYSYSLTRYRFGEEDWFYPVHDSRHNVNVSFAVPLGKGWNVNAAWVYSSGLPFTAQIGWYQHVSPDGEISWLPISGRRGEVRYPTYHRLDAGFTKSFPMFKGKVDAEFYFQVLNVYARRNVLFYEYDVDEESGITIREPMYMIPIPFPSFGIRGRF